MALLLIELLENEKKEEEGYSWAKDLSVPSTATYELCILVQLQTATVTKTVYY